MVYDYLIVGAGLAGLSFVKHCIDNKKSFLLFDSKSEGASSICGGMYNPVVLKRFTPIWKGEEQIDLAEQFFGELEVFLNIKALYPLEIIRKFASIEEQNNWFIATDRPITSKFLSDKIFDDTILNIPMPYKYGVVNKTGFVDVPSILKKFREDLAKEEKIIKEEFVYEDLDCSAASYSYKGNRFRNIIFAEGFQMKANPFFNKLPLDGTKGELLLVKIPGLNLEKIVKSKVFILPMGNDIYKIGATYNWKDKTEQPTPEAREELLKGLNELITLPYEVLEHQAGVRPTVNDRRPLVGQHYQYKNMFILNGLGTRGVLLAPYLSRALFEHIEKNIPLEKEIDIERYYKKNIK